MSIHSDVPPIPVKDSHAKGKLRAKLFQKSKLFLALYLLVLPTTLSLLIFSYYPKFDVFLMSFFRWQPPTVQEFIGLRNFKEAFSDPMFWQSFKLVGILLVANLLKLWPGILAAIALNRLASDRVRYYVQVCFVIPMIIPSMVFLLIWKNFYDPDFGLVNRFLNLTGGMRILNWMDSAMPSLAKTLAPVQAGLIAPIFGGIGGMIMLGALILAVSKRKQHNQSRWGDYLLLLAGAAILPIADALLAIQADPTDLKVLGVAIVIIAWIFFCACRMQGAWIAWPFLLLGGIGVFWQELWRLPLAMFIALALFECIRRKKDEYNHFRPHHQHWPRLPFSRQHLDRIERTICPWHTGMAWQ